MEIRIEWSELSEKQLKDIFDYYSFEASSGVAKKLINRIIDRVSILESNPLAGTKEELLNDYTENYKYLVESNYHPVKNTTCPATTGFFFALPDSTIWIA